MPNLGRKHKINRRNALGAILSTILCIGMVVLAIAYFGGYWKPTFGEVGDVELSELSICQGLDPTDGKPLLFEIEIPANVKNLGICGYIKSETPIRLNILLYRDGEQNPVYSSKGSVSFSPGYFFYELGLPERDRTGIFIVRIYLFRNVIASTVFEIRE